MNELAPPQRITPPVRRSGHCRLIEWKPSDGTSSLVGRCTVAFSGGWIVTSIPVFRRPEGGLSPGTPSIPLLAPDGTQLRDESGKRRYEPIIRFESREARTRWNEAILAALAEGGVT